MTPEEPIVDPNVGWAIERTASRIKDEVGLLLDTKLGAFRQEFIPRKEYEAAHTDLEKQITLVRDTGKEADETIRESVAGACTDIGELKKTVYKGVGIAIALSALVTVLGPPLVKLIERL